MVDARGERSHASDSFADFLAEQHAAAARLRSLADDQFDGVRFAKIVRVEAVSRRQALIDEGLRRLPLFGRHAAVAGRRRSSDLRRGSAERFFHIGRERSEAHAGDRHGSFKFNRFLGEACTEHRLRDAFLAIAFERVSRRARGEEHEIIERRQLPFGSESANVIQPMLGRLLDVIQDMPVERETFFAMNLVAHFNTLVQRRRASGRASVSRRLA